MFHLSPVAKMHRKVDKMRSVCFQESKLLVNFRTISDCI